MLRLPLFLRVALLFLLCLIAPCVHAQQQYLSVTDLGALSGTSNSYGCSVNNSGQVAGYGYSGVSDSYGHNLFHGFIYSNGVLNDLGLLPGGDQSYGYGINVSGQVVGASNINPLDQYGQSVSHAFLYNNGGLTDLGTLGGLNSTGKSINASGQVTGSADISRTDQYGRTITHAFLYSNGVMTDLNSYGGQSAGAAINGSGMITGNMNTGVAANGNPITHAFLYSSGVMRDLGTLGDASLSSYGYGINALGQVTGASFLSGSSSQHAFLYSGGNMTDLGTLTGDYQSYGYGINAAGQIVGKSGSRAMFYSPDIGTIDLNTIIGGNPGWRMVEADSISDTGFVTGYGYPPSNSILHAFRLQVPPPVVPVSLVFSPNSVQVGQDTIGTVTLSAPALANTYVSVDLGGGSGVGLTFSPGQSTFSFHTFFPAARGGQTNIATATLSGVSVSGSIQVDALPYAVFSFAPSSVIVGGQDFTLTVTGTGFTPSTIIYRNGVAPTTFVSSTQLTTVVPASAIAHVGLVTIYAADPSQGTGRTDYQQLPVVNPLPTLTGLSPATVNTGSGALSLTLTGTGFIPYDSGYYLPGSTVYWNGNALPITSLSSTQITATVPASYLTNAAFVPVSVTNPSPGGGQSARLTFAVNDGKPNVSALAPSSAVAGGPDLTLTVTGVNFTPSCAVQWVNARTGQGSATSLATTYISPTQITATVPAALIAQSGFFSISVKDTNTGTLSSLGSSFSVFPPTPTLSSLSPSSAAVGGGAFTLTVTGTGFAPGSGYPYQGCAVLWNGQFLTTTYISPTQLSASVPAANLASAGTAQVTVYSAGANVSTSNALPFTIVDTRPAVSALSPSSVTAGGPDFTLTVTGTNYTPTCVVQWVGTPLTTTYVSSTQLTATVPASYISGAGSATVTVKEMATGAVSPSALPVTISSPTPTLSTISPQTAVAGSSDLTLTVTGTGFTLYNPNYGGTTPPSAVMWNGQRLTTVFNSPTQLTATVPASLLTIPGVAQVTVNNPQPGAGGLTSNALPFNITAPPDTTPPTTTASLSGTAGTNGWYTSAVQVTLSATDNTGGSGVASTFYTLDARPQQTYSVPFTISGDGTHILAFWSVDNAGNTEAVNTQTVKIDATPPTLTFGAPTPAANAAGWNNTPVDVPFTAADVLSGVASAAPGSPVHVAAEGAHQTQTVTVTDNAGNSAGFTSPAVSIDLTAPATAASVSGTTVTLSATDALSGVAATYYAVDGGAQTVYTAPFSVPVTHTVQFWSVDVAGNMESARNLTILPPPVVPVSLSFSPNPVQVGQPTYGTFTLSAPAPTDGFYVDCSRNGQSFGGVILSQGQMGGKFATFFTSEYGGQQVSMAVSANNGSALTTVQVTALPYSLTAISPNSVTLGGPDFTLTLTGTHFTASSVARWNGAALPTTFFSDTQLTALVSASRITLPGANSIAVTDASQGAGGTESIFLFVTNPNPVITSLSPAAAPPGSGPLTLTVTGTGFTPYINNNGFLSGSTVSWNGQTLATTYVSATQVTAQIPASFLTSTGTAQVAVSNPTPGGGTSNTWPFLINSSVVTVQSLTLSPTLVKGGSATSTGTITLSGPAPAGGAAVSQVSSDTSAATLAGTLNIPAGATSAKFKITTYTVLGNKTVTITSSLNGSNQTATLTVTGTAPVTVNGLSLSPISVTGGSASTGTVALSTPAPTGGATVALLSSDTASATVPSSVTVAAGQATALFTATSKTVTITKSVTVTATLGTSSQSATLTVTPASPAITVVFLSLSPTSVKGGAATSTGTVTLSGPAPAGGVSITQSSSDTSAATLAPKLNIAAGLTSAKFKITTYAVATTKTVTITSSLNGTSKAASLTVTH